MSESTNQGPPPLIGAGQVSENKETTVADDSQAEEQKKQEDEAVKASREQQAAVDEVLASQPDRTTDPFGDSTVGFSVTNVDDEDKEDEDPAPTAFNSPREDVPVPTGGAARNWGSPLHVVNDPFESSEGSPFDKGGFVGTDPYRAVIQEGVRDPGNSDDSDD